MKDTGRQKGGLWSIVRNGRVYLKLFTHPDTPWHVKALLIGAVIYVIFPVDLIPDWILGFGIVDDLAIGSLLVGIALKLMNKQQEKNQQPD